MTLHDLMANWPDISPELKIKALEKVFESAKKDLENFGLSWNILDQVCAFEEDDYFGTEGMDI